MQRPPLPWLPRPSLPLLQDLRQGYPPLIRPPRSYSRLPCLAHVPLRRCRVTPVSAVAWTTSLSLARLHELPDRSLELRDRDMHATCSWNAPRPQKGDLIWCVELIHGNRSLRRRVRQHPSPRSSGT